MTKSKIQKHNLYTCAFCVTNFKVQYSQTLKTYRLQSKDIKQMFTVMFNKEENQAMQLSWNAELPYSPQANCRGWWLGFGLVNLRFSEKVTLISI